MESAVGAGLTPERLAARQAHGLRRRALRLATGGRRCAIPRWRLPLGIRPVYKMVDTCAGEFAAATPYFYSTYEREDEAAPLPGPKVIVLGSGPIRIGQGIEFDYSRSTPCRRCARRASGHRHQQQPGDGQHRLPPQRPALL